MSLHSGLRNELSEIFETNIPPRCDCIVAQKNNSGLILISVELKGSIRWQENIKESVEKYARRVARKHISCIFLIINMFGLPKGNYTLECYTLFKEASAMSPVASNFQWKLAEQFREEIDKISSRSSIDKDTIKCANWRSTGLVKACSDVS